MIEFLIRGGYSMIPIILCSVLAGAVIIERGLSLRSRKVLPPALKTNPERFRAPDEDFSRILKEHPSPLSDVLAACYQNRGRDREKNLESLQVVEKKAAGGLEKGLVLLEIVAVVSPLLGLLGTVLGIVRIFSVISRIGVGHAQALSQGIYEALNTTVAGLVVAIPALIAHSIYIRKVDNLMLDIEETARRFIEAIYP